MFRIRLVSGEDTVFRSVEELALGIQSGAVSPDAQIFHTVSQSWLPITAHPEYDQARQRATDLAAVADTEPLPLPALIEPAGGITVPIYQMNSRSAREMAERRRPGWVVPAATSAVVLSLFAVVYLILQPEPPGSDEAIRIASSAPHPASAPSHLAPILSEESMRAARNAPYNLAGRLARAVDSTRRTLEDGSTGIGLSQLLHPDRLRSEGGLRAGRETIASLDSVVQGYRIRRRILDSTYRDSARAFQRQGDWSRADLQEWRLRAPQVESPAEAARLDSLLTTLDRLYALLLEQQGAVTVTPVAIRFDNHQAGLAYDALRAVIIRQASVSVGEGERLPEPLMLLLQGIGAPTLPLRTTR